MKKKTYYNIVATMAYAGHTCCWTIIGISLARQEPFFIWAAISLILTFGHTTFAEKYHHTKPEEKL